MRRQAKKDQRLAREQDTIAMQRTERQELDSLTSRKKLEAAALRNMQALEKKAEARPHAPRRLRPGKPAQRS